MGFDTSCTVVVGFAGFESSGAAVVSAAELDAEEPLSAVCVWTEEEAGEEEIDESEPLGKDLGIEMVSLVVLVEHVPLECAWSERWGFAIRATGGSTTSLGM